MPNIIEINDLTAPELAVYTSLTEAQLRSKARPEAALFIAESAKVIRLALDAGCQPISLLMEHRHIDGQAGGIIARCGDIPIYTAEREVLAALTGYRLTRGILCAMRRPQQASIDQICSSARRIAITEAIADSTNIGAIFRSAAALGIDAVLLTPTCCDPLCRRAVRVSMGTVFQIPWARIGSTPADWPQKGIEYLRQMGFQTAAMALTDHSISIDHPSLAAAEKLAIVLGTEGDGLSPQTIAECDYTVRIPMQHNVDSLNVAAAAAVAFWQLRAQ